VGAVVGGRAADEVEAVGAVEDSEHVKMREAFDVGEAGLELAEDLKGALGGMLRAEAAWDFGGGLVDAADVTDGLGSEHAVPLG
jgi:hypothetical protein